MVSSKNTEQLKFSQQQKEEPSADYIPGPRPLTAEEYRARQPGTILRRKAIQERDERLTKIPKVLIPKRRGGRKISLLRLRRTLLDQHRATQNEEIRQRNQVRITEIEDELRRQKPKKTDGATKCALPNKRE